jgi:two-component system sensor histidine kinase BaeS
MADRPLLGPLGARLALAFALVALAAIGLLAALTVVAARGDVSSLARDQQQATVSDVAQAASTAYTAAHGWAGADLSAAEAVATANGAGLTVLDSAGRPVGSTGGAQATAGAARAVSHTAGVVVGGTRVGTVALRFSDTSLPGPDQRLRDALLRAVAFAAGLAAVLALSVGIVVSRRITRPLVALTGVARAMEGGDREIRVAGGGGTGELGELSSAFNQLADTLQREDALRRAVVADVAHELRTPVTVLQASTEALRDGVLEATPGELSSLLDEAVRLARLVEDLETLASAEAAGMRLDRQIVDLTDVARQAVDSLRPQFGAADLGLAVRSSPVTVAGDPVRLRQVVTNLLTNALKFTPSGGSVTVDVHPVDSTARLEVSDTGVGLAGDDIDHVFERFWRGSRAGRTGGSGIGLAVVAELVRAHGGAVEAAGAPGEGARFVVTLPRTDRIPRAPERRRGGHRQHGHDDHERHPRREGEGTTQQHLRPHEGEDGGQPEP